MVTALVVGHVGQTGQPSVGLRALADAWQDEAASNASLPPLSGDVLSKFATVLFNRQSNTLADLQALVGINRPDDTGAFGILHPAADKSAVTSWIDPSRWHLAHFDEFASGPPNRDQIEKSARYIEHLREHQRIYALASRLPPDDRSPLTYPWADAEDPRFKTTVADREAFWFTLWQGGLKEPVLWDVSWVDKLTWSAASARTPQLADLDFSRAFPPNHQAFRSAVPHALGDHLGRFDPATEPLQLRVEATKLAEAFETPELRDGLSRELQTLFRSPAAVVAHGRSPEFEKMAVRVAMAPLAAASGLTSRWALSALYQNAEGIARSDAFQARVGKSGEPWLRALDVLATAQDPETIQQRAWLSARAEKLQKDGSLLLADISALLGHADGLLQQHGITTGVSIAPKAETLPQAVVALLQGSAIKATLQAPDNNRPGLVFVVDRFDPLTGMAATAGRNQGADLPTLMDHVVNRLQAAGYLATWRFRQTESPRAAGDASAMYVYRQEGQQPQQGSGPDHMPNAFDPRLGRGLFLHNLPDMGHLRASAADNSISVKRDKLKFLKPVFDLLVQDLGGEAPLNRMLNALVMDSHGEFGLPALSKAWLAAAHESAGRHWPALTGTRLLRLAQVLFNDEAANTLGAMAALMGVSGPTYRGILHPSSDLQAIRESADDKTRALRDQFWRTLEARGLDMPALERIMKGASPADQGILLLGPAPSNKPEPAAIQWALAVSETPELGDLDFAALFGGEAARRARSDSAPEIPASLDLLALQRRIDAQNAAQKVFTDPGLRASLSHHLFASGPEQLPADPTLRAAAVHVVTERLLAGSDVDLPGIVEELRGDVNGAAMQSSSDTSDAAFFAQLEELAMSQAPMVAVNRELLLVSARYRQMEKHRALREKIARHLARDDTPFRGGDGPETSTFRGALIAMLGEAGIRARMEPATQDHPERIIVAPSASAPTGGAASPSVSEKMALVINELAGVGYEMEWKFDDNEPAL